MHLTSKTGSPSYFITCLLLIVFSACKKEEVNESEYPSPTASSVNKTVALQTVNDARSKGCQCGDTYYNPTAALQWNDRLETAAIAHTANMYGNKFFSHQDPQGQGPADRVQQAGYNWTAVGENIAYGQKTEQEVIAAWLQSPEHCRNIMNPLYKEMGLARKDSLWTQVFGSR